MIGQFRTMGLCLGIEEKIEICSVVADDCYVTLVLSTSAEPDTNALFAVVRSVGRAYSSQTFSRRIISRDRRIAKMVSLFILRFASSP